MSTDTSIANESVTELTLPDVWDHRDELILRGFESSKPTLIEALPVSGKSHGVIKWAESTGHKLTVLAPRHTLLDEYAERCEEFGLTFARLPSFYRDCGGFEKNDEGEFKPINDAAKELETDYKQGLDGRWLHSGGPNLPCQADGKCPFVAKKEKSVSEYDVLLGTYRHAYGTKGIKERYVAFDEFPKDAFLKTLDDGIAPVVSAYLEDKEDELPFVDHRDFISQLDDSEVQDDIEAWKSNVSRTRDRSHVQRSSNPAAHTIAPMATKALIEEDRLENNWGYSDLGEGRIAVRNRKSNEWTFLLPPDLSTAESVIGLDGTPNKTLWETVLNSQMQSFRLLDNAERETYLRDILGYHFVQTTGRWKPIQSGEGASPPKDLALIEGICQREEPDLALISSQNAIREYNDEGLDELTNTTDYYGALKGMNDFGKERLGLVLGCPFPSDDGIEMWAALAGESAKRKRGRDGEKLRGPETDFGSFGNEVMHTLVHDEVFQAAMRFGREREDSVRGATVYLHASAVPAWLPVERQVPSIHSWIRGKNGMRKTVEAILQIEAWEGTVWAATDVYPHIDLTRRTVRNRLEDLAEEGYIKFEGKYGQGESKHYSNVCLEDAGRFGDVNFSA